MDMLKPTGKVLYVQLNRDQMRFAVLNSAGEPLSCHAVPVPSGAVIDGEIKNREAISALLKKVQRRPEFKQCSKVAFSLCTSQVVTDTVTVPALPAKNLERLVQANKDMYFKEIDMSSYKLQWQIVGQKPADKEVQVQLWAVPMEILKGYYLAANECGLSVARIDYCGNSLAAAVGASFARPVKKKEKAKLTLNTEITFGKKKEQPAQEEPTVPEGPRPDTQMYIFMDNDLLGATFVQNAQVVQQRFISCGSDPSYQFYELAMMVDVYRSTFFGRGSSLTGYLCGGLAEDAKTASELSDILGISLDVPANGYEPQFVLCVGAGRNQQDFGVAAMDIPRSGRAPDTGLLQYVLLAATGLMLIGTVALLLISRLSWTAQENKLQNQQQQLLIRLQQTSDYADKYEKYESDYQKYSSDWETIFGSLRTYNDNLVLMLEELEATLPVNTNVTALQIAADGLTVQFACSSKEEAAYLIMALRKLEYADLVAISNLSGGGGGAASSYGSGDTEQPPKDGSKGTLSDKQIEILAGLMMANMNQKQLMNTFLGLSDSETQRLESVYAKKPNNHYSTLSALQGQYSPSATYSQRCDAVHEMLTTNPFAIQIFVDLMKADMKSETPVLLTQIMPDIMGNSTLLNAMMNGGLESAEQAFSCMEQLVAIMCKNETNLSASEKLFCTDSKMQKWYIYHLEMELGLQSKSALSFLDMDLVIADLMNGSFNTGDAALDAKLNALIPEAVWTALKSMEGVTDTTPSKPVTDPKPGPDSFARSELMAMLKKYASSGSTGNDYVDQMVAAYLADGTSGDDRWDAWLKQYAYLLENGDSDPEITKKPSDYDESELIALLFKYLNENTTGDDYLDGLFDRYLATGSTGSREWDNWLKKYRSYLTEQGTSASGSPGQYPVYFVVALQYKEALIREELDRKGLDYSEKIEKVEVLG